MKIQVKNRIAQSKELLSKTQKVCGMYPLKDFALGFYFGDETLIAVSGNESAQLHDTELLCHPLRNSPTMRRRSIGIARSGVPCFNFRSGCIAEKGVRVVTLGRNTQNNSLSQTVDFVGRQRPDVQTTSSPALKCDIGSQIERGIRKASRSGPSRGITGHQSGHLNFTPALRLRISKAKGMAMRGGVNILFEREE